MSTETGESGEPARATASEPMSDRMVGGILGCCMPLTLILSVIVAVLAAVVDSYRDFSGPRLFPILSMALPFGPVVLPGLAIGLWRPKWVLGFCMFAALSMGCLGACHAAVISGSEQALTRVGQNVLRAAAIGAALPALPALIGYGLRRAYLSASAAFWGDSG